MVSRKPGHVIRILAGRMRGLVRTHTGVAAVAAALLFAAVAATAVSAARFAGDVLSGLPDRHELQTMGHLAQATTVYDLYDRPAFTISKEARIDVPLEQVSRHVVRAILAVEDQRFFEHGGVDPVRLVAAAWANLRQQRAAQGASTLTQQLARQTFLTPAKTIRRKLREMVIAQRIERLFTKNEILELYLNKVYFGDGLYGIEAASRGYFAKPSSQLTVAEAALLAGLVQSPSAYAPTINLARAVSRRNVVLQRMRDERAITAAEWEAARLEPVTLRDGLQRDEAWGQYFKEHVRVDLVNRFGWQMAYQGGLRVYTTIDPRLQREAEEQVARSVAAIEARRAAATGAKKAAKATAAAQPPLEAALVALDPTSGYVVAMVGGRSYGESRFNRAVQARRQPGSAFKPLVFAAALESGFTPATMLDHLDDPVTTPEGNWVPEDEHADGDTMTLRTALRTSSNRAAVRLLQQVGIAKTIDYAHRLGIGTMPNVPSIALGSGEVTLLSLASAYLPFAARGIARPPVLIRTVVDRDGRELYRQHDESSRVVSESTAFLMAQMLADVVNAGTGVGVRRLGFTLPAAGKTGTTNDFNDAWFIGFTPRLLTGVWIGFDQPKTIIANGYAGDLAVPLWTRFMLTATKGQKAEWFPQPSDVTALAICRLSGLLATPGCQHVLVTREDGDVEERSTVYTEYFVRGTEPTGHCPLHAPSFFQRITGWLSDGGEPQVPASASAGNGDPASPIAPRGPDRVQKEPDRKKGFWGRLLGALKGKDHGKDPKKDGGVD